MLYFIISIGFFLLALFPILFLVRAIWKNWEDIKTVWEKMLPFERSSFNVGLYLYFITPILKGHSYSDSYLGVVSINILYALASALFAVGALAFIKHSHELRDRRNNS